MNTLITERVRSLREEGTYMYAKAEPKSSWAAYVRRLRANGKTGKQVVVAIMYKLLRVLYGVLKTHQPFDLALAFSTCFS